MRLRHPVGVSDTGSGDKAGEAVAIWVPAWQRVWLPLVIGTLLLTNAGLQIAESDAPVALFGAAAMALLFWSFRIPLLFSDSTGVRLGHGRFVPWSDVAELRSRPDHGRKHPVELVMRDGTRRPLLSDLDPTVMHHLEHLLAASHGGATPPA